MEAKVIKTDRRVLKRLCATNYPKNTLIEVGNYIIKIKYGYYSTKPLESEVYSFNLKNELTAKYIPKYIKEFLRR